MGSIITPLNLNYKSLTKFIVILHKENFIRNIQKDKKKKKNPQKTNHHIWLKNKCSIYNTNHFGMLGSLVSVVDFRLEQKDIHFVQDHT